MADDGNEERTKENQRMPSPLWVGGAFVGLLAMFGAAFASPELMLRKATRDARTCVAAVTAPRGPELPDCAPGVEAFAWPASINYTEHDATYRAEELRGRIAMDRYIDAAVGHPNADALATRALDVKSAQEMMDGGSRRVSLEELGPAVVAPHMGKLASLYGDRMTLIDHFEYYGLWHTRRDALEAAVLEADFDEVDRIAHQLGEWNVREADLRSATGAALCITAPSEGHALLATMPVTRSEKRYANIQRDYGEIFAALKACAAKAGQDPPERPSSYNAGLLDAVAQNALTELRLAEGDGKLAEPLADAGRLLSSAEELPPRARPLLIAAVLALSDKLPSVDDLLSFTEPIANEPPLSPVILRVGALLAEGPSLNAVAPVRWLDEASARLEPIVQREAAGARRAKLDKLLGALLLQAGADHARNGSSTLAKDRASRACSFLASSTKACALSVASALYVSGDATSALATLSDAASSDEGDARIEMAFQTLRALLLQRAGKHAEAASTAERLTQPKARGEIDELALEAAWTRLALAPGSLLGIGSFGSPDGDATWQGAADTSKRYLTMGAPFVRSQLAAWARALESDDRARRAFRYEALSLRGDMLILGVSLMFAADRLLGEGYDGEAHEVWLDAFTTIDSRRVRLRSYAFMRAEAAFLRGDSENGERWFERLRVLRGVAKNPQDLEVTRLLRL